MNKTSKKQSSFGVGNRLLLAFSAIAALTIIVSLTSLLMFLEVNSLGSVIKDETVPEFSASEALNLSAEKVRQALPHIRIDQTAAMLQDKGRTVMAELNAISHIAQDLKRRRELSDALFELNATTGHLRAATQKQVTLAGRYKERARQRDAEHKSALGLIDRLIDRVRKNIIHVSYALESAPASAGSDEDHSRLLRRYQQLMETQFRLSAAHHALSVIPLTTTLQGLDSAENRLSLHLRILTRIALTLEEREFRALMAQTIGALAKTVGEKEGLFGQSKQMVRLAEKLQQMENTLFADAEKIQALSREILSRAKSKLDKSVAETNRSIANSIAIIIAVTIGAIVISGLIMWLYIVRNIAFRLNRLIQVMAALAEGDLKISVPNLGRDELGAVSGSLGVFKDHALALQTREQQLAVSEERYNFAVQGSGGGIWDWDVAGDDIYLSQRSIDILQVPDRINGKQRFNSGDLDEVLTGEEPARLRRTVRKLMIDNVPIDFETRLNTGTGTDRWVRIRGNAVRNTAGWAVRVAGSVDDITDRKQIENTLRRQTAELARSNAELEEFAHVASHDLQEPLRMVASYCELLDQKYSGTMDEAGAKYLNFAVQGAHRMRQMIVDMLAYSRVGNHDLSIAPVDLNSLMHRVAADLEGYRLDHNGIIDIAPLPDCLGDASLMERLFLNLIQNGLKYNEDAVPVVRISGEMSDETVTIRVEDNGIGIPPAYRSQIFQIFRRLHGPEEYPGTGIGLAIAKRVVERLNGALYIEDTEMNGTCFCIMLSRADGAVQESGTVAA